MTKVKLKAIKIYTAYQDIFHTSQFVNIALWRALIVYIQLLYLFSTKGFDVQYTPADSLLMEQLSTIKYMYSDFDMYIAAL